MGTPLTSVERVAESAVRSLGFSLLADHVDFLIILNAFAVVEKAGTRFVLLLLIALNTLLRFSWSQLWIRIWRKWTLLLKLFNYRTLVGRSFRGRSTAELFKFEDRLNFLLIWRHQLITTFNGKSINSSLWLQEINIAQTLMRHSNFIKILLCHWHWAGIGPFSYSLVYGMSAEGETGLTLAMASLPASLFVNFNFHVCWPC